MAKSSYSCSAMVSPALFDLPLGFHLVEPPSSAIPHDADPARNRDHAGVIRQLRLLLKKQSICTTYVFQLRSVALGKDTATYERRRRTMRTRQDRQGVIPCQTQTIAFFNKRSSRKSAQPY